MSRAKREDRARFATMESTPVDRAKARAIAEQSARLAQFIEELCLTNEALWDENHRLQAGVDNQMAIVAQLRARVSHAERRARAAGTFGMLGGVSLDHDLVDRLRLALVSAHNRRFLVANIEIDDMEALITTLDQFAALLKPAPPGEAP